MALDVLNGLDVNNTPIANVPTPSLGHHAANKDYVDNAIRGLDWKQSVRVASTGNVNVSNPGTSTFDGVSLSNGDRVLLKDQSTASQNGIYTFATSSTAMVRATDADSSSEVTGGMAVTVTEGTVNADTVWILTTNDTITLGSTNLAFTELGGGSGSSYTAGNGLTESPAGTFNVGAGTGITVNANDVAIDTTVVPRKYSANVGNGSSTSIAISHNLGSRDVVVQVYEAGSPYDMVLCDVSHTDTNTVTLGFAVAPTSAQYRVVVLG
jgi:phage-related tail fiber protein